MCGRCLTCTDADNKMAPAEMPGLFSWQELHKVRKGTAVTVFNAIGGAVNFLCDLLKGRAVEDLTAKDASIQLMEDVFVDERTHLGTCKRI